MLVLYQVLDFVMSETFKTFPLHPFLIVKPVSRNIVPGQDVNSQTIILYSVSNAQICIIHKKIVTDFILKTLKQNFIRYLTRIQLYQVSNVKSAKCFTRLRVRNTNAQKMLPTVKPETRKFFTRFPSYET